MSHHVVHVAIRVASGWIPFAELKPRHSGGIHDLHQDRGRNRTEAPLGVFALGVLVDLCQIRGGHLLDRREVPPSKIDVRYASTRDCANSVTPYRTTRTLTPEGSFSSDVL